MSLPSLAQRTVNTQHSCKNHLFLSNNKTRIKEMIGDEMKGYSDVFKGVHIRRGVHFQIVDKKNRDLR